ncbi:MAG: single-stranded DNA-binding protein [Planctomycetaceae bacterium]|nr:single-stranded DNA-binding protein [Planctomycetaceae bacterium]
MANFNKVILLGNLTRDPQLSYLPNQTAVVDFGLAINRTWTGQDGQKKEEVCFVDCRTFGKPAETINKYCKKGKPLMVEGRLTFDSWTGKDGQKHSRHRVTVESFQFISSAPGGQGGQGVVGGESQIPANDAPMDQTPSGGGDDIPF